MAIFIVIGQHTSSNKTTIAMGLAERLNLDHQTTLLQLGTTVQNFQWTRQFHLGFALEQLNVAEDHIFMLEYRLEQLIKSEHHVVVDVAHVNHQMRALILKYADKILLASCDIEEELSHISTILAKENDRALQGTKLKLFALHQVPSHLANDAPQQPSNDLADHAELFILNGVMDQPAHSFKRLLDEITKI